MSTNPRYISPIPAREMERRWDAVRKAMKSQDIDCIIMQHDGGVLDGYVRYFTDSPAGHYRTTVLFPANDEMTIINHGAPGVGPSRPGIKSILMFPYVQTFNFTSTYAAEATVKYIRENNFKKIGFVNLTWISAAFYNYVTENIKGIEIVDATDLVDEIKTVKSQDEMEVIMKTIELHDKIAAEFPNIARVGRYEHEIRSDLIKLSIDLGSEQQNIMVGSDPVKSVMVPGMMANRKVEAGDILTCLIEISGVGGYFGEVGRVWALGEPSKELQDAYEASKKAQQYIAGLMKPGADPAEIYKKGNEFMVSMGYRGEERLMAHGQGTEMVERPGIAPNETMKLKEGMFIAIHLGAHKPNIGASSTDNLLITKDGAKLLTKTPQKIITI